MMSTGTTRIKYLGDLELVFPYYRQAVSPDHRTADFPSVVADQLVARGDFEYQSAKLLKVKASTSDSSPSVSSATADTPAAHGPAESPTVPVSGVADSKASQ